MPITPALAARLRLAAKGRPGDAPLLLRRGGKSWSEKSLRQSLIDANTGQVDVIVCEADYRALKRGIEHLPPPCGNRRQYSMARLSR